MKVLRLVIAISIIAILFGSVFISDALGLWQMSGNRNIGNSQGAKKP